MILTQSDASTIRIVENLRPPAIGHLHLEMREGFLELEWISHWDGAALEKSGDLNPPQWFTVFATGASGTSGEQQRWIDYNWRDGKEAYYRLNPARRWPAP